MPHLHPNGIDFVVSAFVVYKKNVLLVDHKKLKGWFPPGGHIEHVGEGGRAETPDEALFRELQEETGLGLGDVAIFDPSAQRPPLTEAQLHASHRTSLLLRPWRVDLHHFGDDSSHRHVALCYLLRAWRSRVKLEADAHNNLMWWGLTDLMGPTDGLLPTVRAYALDAIAEAGW